MSEGRSSGQRAFAALFPPLIAADAAARGPSAGFSAIRNATSVSTNTDSGIGSSGSSAAVDSAPVDISVDDIVLPTLERAVDAAIYSALRRWNELEPVRLESGLSYTERVKKYQAIVRWVLYQNHDQDDNSDDNDDNDNDNGNDNRLRNDRTRIGASQASGARTRTGRDTQRKQAQSERTVDSASDSATDSSSAAQATQATASDPSPMDTGAPTIHATGADAAAPTATLTTAATRETSGAARASEGADSADAETARDREIAQRKRTAAVRHARRVKRRDRARLRRQLKQLEQVFQALPSAAQLRSEREPSARVSAFVSTYTSKTRALQQKRSMGDTKTHLCFEFARPAPALFPLRAPAGAGDGDGGEDDDDSGGSGALGNSRSGHSARAGQQQQQQQHEPGASRAHNQRTSNLLRSCGVDPETLETGAHAATADGHSDSRTADDELVIWFDVLHPSKDPAKTQSFLVRESQTLADVVDLVVCATDQRLSDHAKPSKLVYFDETFYVDRRHPEHVDYADAIRTWLRKSPTRTARYGAPTASRAMDGTAFRDLPLKVDLPGVYIHQGECEHLIRIRDARLPHEYDAPSHSPSSRSTTATAITTAITTTTATPPDSSSSTRDAIGHSEEDHSTGAVAPDADAPTSAFPLRLPNPHFRALRKCFVCQQYSAKYICYGDRLAIADPMFFCERCYRAAHFDQHGELVYRDFQSFPFIQD